MSKHTFVKNSSLAGALIGLSLFPALAFTSAYDNPGTGPVAHPPRVLSPVPSNTPSTPSPIDPYADPNGGDPYAVPSTTPSTPGRPSPVDPYADPYSDPYGDPYGTDPYGYGGYNGYGNNGGYRFVESSAKDHPMTRVTRDEHNIYFRTPWKAMRSQVRKEAIKESIELLKRELDVLFPNSKTIDRLSDRLQKSKALDTLVNDIGKFAQTPGADQNLITEVMPSAFMLFVGGKFTANFKFGGGPSLSIGIVVVPTLVQKVSLKKNPNPPYYKSYSNFELDWALVAIPSANLGVGIGGGAGTSVGVAAIWGPVTNAQDFAGPVISLSSNFNLGIGMNVKLGVLRNGPGRYFPFAAGSAEFGAITGTEWHLNGSGILPIDEIFNMIARNDQSNFSGIYQTPYYNYTNGSYRVQPSGEQILKEHNIKP